MTITPRKTVSERPYCVRLCDGFYFPMSRLASGSPQEEASLCNALCPGAKTAVYTLAGNGIEDAVARAGGKHYKSLPGAFAYRKNLSPLKIAILRRRRALSTPFRP